MPGPTPKPLQLGHDNAVVDLVPTVHDQMAGHGIHGIELAAGVGGTQHRLVVCASSNGMREASDSGVTRARGVNGRDIGRLCAERTAIVEANGTETIISLATQLVILYAAFFGFAIVVYGLSVKIIGKQSPFKFLKAILPAALNAFGTCSSSATIPLSKQCMEEEMGVSNQITSIAIPLGATVNMDAVSILMSFMIMFFANACGINVSVSMMVIVLLANVLLSVGTPGVPGGAIASFAALATMAGLPAGVMGVSLSITTLCDMGATCVNVIGDLACCVALKGRLKIDENK